MKFKWSIIIICLIKVLNRSEANTPSSNQCSDQINGKYKVTPLLDKKYGGGESPVYVQRLNSLFWVDFSVSSINRWDFGTNKTYSGFINKMPVVFVIPVEDKPNFYLCGDGEKVAMICWDGYSTNVASITFLYSFNNENQMLDDGDVSKDGSRFIVDSAPNAVNASSQEPSPVYLVFEKKPRLLISDPGFSNGLRFAPTGNCIYLANSDTREIHQYSLDEKTNTVGEPIVIFSFVWCNLIGNPDSFTMDANGNLWVASDLGGLIVVVNPKTKSLIGVIKIGGPKLRLTNCIWGGNDYKTLYVTSRYETEAEKNSVPEAGLVFKVENIGNNEHGLPRQFIKASTIVPDNIKLPECKSDG